MALYARLNADLTAVVEERELDPQLVAQFIADNNPKAAYWKPLNVDPQPTLGANQVLDGHTYTIGESSVTKSWNVRNLTAEEIDVKYIYDNRSTIKSAVLAMEAGSGTSAERLNRVEAVLGKLTRFVVGQILPVLFLLLPMVGKGALDLTAANSHGVAQSIGPISGGVVTVAAWAYQTTFANRVVFSISDGGSGRASVGFNSGSRIVGSFSNAAGSFASAQATLDETYINRWVHLAAVAYSTTSRKLFVDGVEVASATSSLTLPTFDRAVVGANISSGLIANHSLCLISKASVWGIALTDSEIASLAAGQSANKVRPQSLVFYAPLTNIGPGGGSGSTINTVGPPVLLTNTVTQATTQPRIYR